MYIYTHVYVHTYTHKHTYTYTHKYTHNHTHIYTHIYRKKKLVLYSKVKRNQPDRCRFYKADMDKHVASIV